MRSSLTANGERQRGSRQWSPLDKELRSSLTANGERQGGAWPSSRQPTVAILAHRERRAPAWRCIAGVTEPRTSCDPRSPRTASARPALHGLARAGDVLRSSLTANGERQRKGAGRERAAELRSSLTANGERQLSRGRASEMRLELRSSLTANGERQFDRPPSSQPQNRLRSSLTANGERQLARYGRDRSAIIVVAILAHRERRAPAFLICADASA